MTDELAKKLKKPFKILHHAGYVILIASFLMPCLMKVLFHIGISEKYPIFMMLIDAFAFFLLVPSNYIDVYEDRNNLQFRISRCNPTYYLGSSIFGGIVCLLGFAVMTFS